MPVHPFAEGVTEIVALMAALPVLAAVNKAISPEPLAGIPIAVFEFVHVYVVPATVLLKLVAATEFPLQTTMFAGTVTAGRGLTVMV